MVQETSIRLPARLMGVVRSDGASVVASGSAMSVPAPHALVADAAAVMQELARDREHIQRVLAGLTEAAASFRAQNHKLVLQMRQTTVELACAIASRFLHGRIQAGEFPVETLVHKALQRLDSTPPVTVSLHPADLALLQQRLGEEIARYYPPAEVNLVADPVLPRGGCRAQAGEVSVWADLENRLAELQQRLLESVTE